VVVPIERGVEVPFPRRPAATEVDRGLCTVFLVQALVEESRQGQRTADAPVTETQNLRKSV